MPARRFPAQPLAGEAVEILQEGESLDGAAGLRGDDVERPFRIEPLGEGKDRAGVGAVEDMEVEEAFPHPEDPAEDLGREAGAAHAQEKAIRETLFLQTFREGTDRRDIPRHGFRRVQPAQPVGDFRRFGFPDGEIPLPDALRDAFRPQPRGGLIRRGPAGPEPRRSDHARHRRTSCLQSRENAVPPPPPTGIYRTSSSFTLATAASTVKPNFSNRIFAGALAPKPFMPITAPSRPM
ncbi:MAG: hypothetical protein A4E73_00015 [Syntrophaceae bacterium PtaU1.Bin231]|nr:MAG: hypothetical protein A4E73_00015 [Syntrophaceae bacterium PtaU1.Bin231]